MRRRILSAMLLVATVGVLLFALPLAISVGRLNHNREVTRLQREATRALTAVPSTGLRGTDPIELPAASSGVRLALYDSQARLVSGNAPTQGGREVARALAGRVSEGTQGGRLVVAIPIVDEESVVGVAIASESTNVARNRTYAEWAVMGGLALVALAIASLLARRQARRIAGPIDEIEALAVRLGDGDFTVRLDPRDSPELARAAIALNTTAEQLGNLVERERSFSADVSHQLATPLTSLRLELENALTLGIVAPETLARSLAEVERMQRIVETLLTVARDGSTPSATCAVDVCCDEIATRHRAGLAAVGRPLRIDVADHLPLVRCSKEVLGEILEVLVDNAEQHGRGVVSVRARTRGTGVVIEVEDAGDGLDPDAAQHAFERRSPGATGNGIGLALAQALATAHGARLRLARPSPHPIFSVALVSALTEDAGVTQRVAAGLREHT